MQRQFHVRVCYKNISYVVPIFPLFPSYFVISFLSCFCTLLSASEGMFIISQNLLIFSCVYFKTEYFQSLNFYVSIIMCCSPTHTHKLRVSKQLRRRWKKKFFYKTLWGVKKRICYHDLQTDMRFYPPYMFQSAHPPLLPPTCDDYAQR